MTEKETNLILTEIKFLLEAIYRQLCQETPVQKISLTNDVEYHLSIKRKRADTVGASPYSSNSHPIRK